VTLGAIDLVVFGFPGSKFTGKIAPAIIDLVERDIVHIVDALFITKDDDGNVTIVEFEDITDDPDFGSLAGSLGEQLDLVSAEDAEALAAELPAGSSALALVFEHRWMIPVRDAIKDAGGMLLAEARVPGEVVDEVLDALADA
jgi:uncharacterized membrane protein